MENPKGLSDGDVKKLNCILTKKSDEMLGSVSFVNVSRIRLILQLLLHGKTVLTPVFGEYSQNFIDRIFIFEIT